MLGHKIEYSAPWYFPLCWAVKFPVALQVLAAAGLVALVLRVAGGHAGVSDAFVWFPPALIMALAVWSHIHMGFRHVMPVIPFLILGGGFALERWRRRPAGRLIVAAGMIWLAAATAYIYPQGISYFNEWVKGPQNGWKYLADSNLDWGQNLPELGEYMARQRVQKLNIYYFGSDVLRHYIPEEKLAPQVAPWGREWEKEKRLDPAPGVYAISVNTLLGYFFSPAYQDYFAYFKARRPDARAGHSIFIYHVNAAPRSGN